ncbi:hypothetical protein POM88_007620 [Heracleum sosnowskyi]|uniref:Uncharacterized protein n=1 Tax=Heracleum sosnowskyi TaxID=360622 RepID=A0AAD8N6G3_9APIA|nr:hypothetical protein POM88_007620 [Heracleum sosnowskyi]
MAQFSSIFFILAIVSGATAVSAQLAPAPTPDVGASFALPVSTLFIATSLLISLTALIFILAIVSGATAVSAQLAPAPSPDVGASFALPVSTAFIATSLLISLCALLRH